MEIKPRTETDIFIKNGEQVVHIQTDNLYGRAQVVHLHFSEEYEIKQQEGHIAIIRKEE